ncbi:MAG: hypothetical protein HYU66_25585, partial [Armatimonadetes bacterium]|nr:hypothetical protein [Armatimonadota bacterium]
MAHDERVGLVTVPGGAGIVPSWLDARQWILAGAAARRVLCALLDGPGVYSGGAAELADLTGGGTLYPAFLAMVADDSAEVWPAGSGGTSAITFNVAGTAAGDARLYLVVSKLAGVSPAAAAGNLGGYTLVADDVANPPPADSLLLGSGTLAASAFTAYTPAAGVLRLGYIPLVDPAVAGHLVQLLADGTLEDAGLSLGDFYTQAEIDALLADLFTVAADTGDPQTVGLGDVVSVSGLPGATQTVEAAGPTTTVKLAQLPLLGPPASDDPYAPGDLVEDAAGAQFVAQSTGSGGGITGWQQLTGGTLPIDSIDSPPEAADFNPGSI